MAVHDQSEIRFPIPQRKLPWELFFVVAGHRWLVAQPGGLTLHFAVQLADLLCSYSRWSWSKRMTEARFPYISSDEQCQTLNTRGDQSTDTTHGKSPRHLDLISQFTN